MTDEARHDRASISYSVIFLAMPLSIQHRHAVLLADRTGDVGTITTVVTEVLAASPETTPLEIETALRDGAAQSYLIAGERLSIVLGLPAMVHTLAAARSTPEQNRAALVTRNE